MSTHNVAPRLANQAFSLVELAIVLVILGLLAGGVLSGQSLIRAAEMRSIVSQYQNYATAVQSFRDKYFALPGDMANAQSFWDKADADAATCATTASTDKKTCNGNGDGIILPSTGANESFRFWQHLANAGLIEGQYDGITHGSVTYAASTANAPKGKIGNSLWYVWNWGSASPVSESFAGTYDNILGFGQVVAGQDPQDPILTPAELWNLDSKLDDGMPAIGKVVAYTTTGGLSACTTTNASDSAAIQAATLSAAYLLSATGKTCSIVFRQQF